MITELAQKMNSLETNEKYFFIFAGVLTACGFFFGTFYYLLFQDTHSSLVCFSASAVMCLILVAHNIFSNFKLTTLLSLINLFSALFILALFDYGVRGRAISWFTVVPFMACYLSGKKQGAIWLALSLMAVLSIYLIEIFGYLPTSLLVGTLHSSFAALSILGIVSVLGFTSILLTIVSEQYAEKEDVLRNQAEKTSRLASMGELAGGIAHEINNPISIIVGKSMIMDRKISKGIPIENKEIAGFVTEIHQTASRASDIIISMKDLIRDGKDDTLEWVSLLEIMQEVESIASNKLKTKSVTLQINENNIIWGYDFLCKKSLFAQVFINLVNNSIDAVEQLEERWIEIVPSLAENSLQISVIDSGKGIPKSIEKDIWNPLFTSKAPGKGTGLGLSLVNNIISDLNGTININSKSKNTQFDISLPRKNVSQSKSKTKKVVGA